MIKIAICEDEDFFKVALVKALEDYLKQRAVSYEIDTYKMGEELLAVNHQQYDIIYLDVEMQGGLDGIEIAKLLRKEENNKFIIFLTSHQEQVYKAFEVSAFRYLLKPIDHNILGETMDKLLQRIMHIKKDMIVLAQGKDYIQLPTCEIVYIETESRKVRVHTVHQVYTVEDRIGDIEKKLPKLNFFRIHRCYLINLRYVESHKENIVFLQQNKEVYISRLKIPTFKQVFIEYLRRENDVGFI